MTMQATTTNRHVHEAVSFNVSDVPLAEELLPEIDYEAAVSGALGQPIESWSDQGHKLIDMGHNKTGHPFIMMLHEAYAQHRPIIISPDHIWLLICHGFAAHVNNHAEELRHHFVQHEGQEEIVIIRCFHKGYKHNPWENTFPEFCAEIRNYVGEDLHNALIADFSTTTPVEKAAFELSMMDAMQEYFIYRITTCGIPHITLEGTADDWQWIAERVNYFRQFGLDWWIDALVPILDKIAETAQGKIDINFWSSIYKLDSGSGSAYIQGWITQLFPYVNGEPNREGGGDGPKRSHFIGAQYISRLSGLTTRSFLAGLRTVPFIWDATDDKTYLMNFAGGFVGMVQDPQTAALRAEIGWAVMDRLE